MTTSGTFSFIVSPILFPVDYYNSVLPLEDHDPELLLSTKKVRKEGPPLKAYPKAKSLMAYSQALETPADESVRDDCRLPNSRP
jgi:hypothetical protein